MNYYVLFYDLVDDYLSRRPAYRAEHLQLAQEAQQEGRLVMAGALSDPADRALLVFRGPDDSVAREFANNDPYVANGLVANWEIRPWTVVIGDVATGA